MPEKTCYYTSASAESSKAQLNMDSNGYQYTIFGKGPWETNYAQSDYPGYILTLGSMGYKLCTIRINRGQAMYSQCTHGILWNKGLWYISYIQPGYTGYRQWLFRVPREHVVVRVNGIQAVKLGYPGYKQWKVRVPRVHFVARVYGIKAMYSQGT